MKRSRFRLAASAVLLAIALACQTACASIVAFVDFGDFGTELNKAAASAGVAAFSPSEISSIQSGIVSQLATVYSDYDVTFTTTDPGGNRERIWYGATTGVPGALGLADGIDWLNQSANDLARVFTANFGFIFEAGDPRAAQIAEITTALAGTGAHELGHNVGLRHYDSFGDTAFTGGPDGGGPSGGIQNTHTMATGSTGLGEAGREIERTLSDLSKAKLEFSSGIVNNPLGRTPEQGAPHNTPATAQALTLSALSISGYGKAALVTGTIATSFEFDYYSFSGKAGDKVAINMISSGVTDNGGFFGGNTVDTVVGLYGTDGTTLLAENNDIYYNSSAINSAGGLRTRDSLVLNFVLPTDGTYYIQARGYASDTGGYQLLLLSTGDSGAPPIPEPATLVVWSTLGFFGMALYRRRRKSA